jgi:CHAD domain-containing protein
VQDADELVASVMKRLAEVFAAEREKLERDWDSGEDVSTEDLRVALRRYRSFFDRLLAV